MTYKLVKLYKFINDLTEERKIEITDSDIIEEPTLKTKTHSLEVKKIVNGSNIKVKKRVLLKEGDLVFAKLHTQNGAFAFANKEFKSTTTFIPCKVDISLCREDYLYIVLDKYIKFLQITNDGVGRETFKSKDILNLEIPLPSLEEQENIVKKLESINGKIEKIKSSKEKNNIKILKEQILKQAIEGKLVDQNPNDEPASILLEKIKLEKEKLIKEGKLKKQKELTKITEDEIPFEIPENWAWCRIGDICNFQGGYAYKSDKYIELSDNQVIRLGNVKIDNLLLTANPVYISDNYANDTNNYNIKNGDILITMTGTKGKRDYCFTLLVNSNEKKLFLNQRVGCLRFNNILHLSLINRFLKSDKILDLIFEKETGTANQGNIGSNTILETFFPLPPLEEQKRIVEKIEEFEEKLNKLDKLQTKQLKELEALKNAVLDKALNGELVK